MPRKATPEDEWLDAEYSRCAADPDRFNSVILGRTYTDEGVTCPADYWGKQREICRSVVTHRITAAPSGNGVGKSFLGAGLAAWFTASHPGSRAVVAAPTQGQLRGVLWSRLEEAYASAARNGCPLGGRMKSLSWQMEEGWELEGFGSGSVESKSGRHSRDLLALVDEASGVPASVMEAIDSLNPSKIIYLGNPLRPEGKFYEICEQSGDNPQVNVIRIPSTLSPDIERDRSPRGMADRTWLEGMRHEYGEDSIWWASHVLAMFPGSIEESLLPIPWLTLAGQTIHVQGREPRIGVDLGEGTGGDPSCVVIRDENGIREWEASNRWDLDTTAERVRHYQDKHDVPPSAITYDQTGIGADFDNRLRPLGIVGARGYKGSREGGDKFANLRSAAAWLFRQRLDPKRQIRKPGPPSSKAVLWVPQQPFSIPRAFLDAYRDELQGVRYQNTARGEIALEPKEAFVKRLKKSPNAFDATIMTFAYP